MTIYDKVSPLQNLSSILCKKNKHKCGHKSLFYSFRFLLAKCLIWRLGHRILAENIAWNQFHCLHAEVIPTMEGYKLCSDEIMEQRWAFFHWRNLKWSQWWRCQLIPYWSHLQLSLCTDKRLLGLSGADVISFLNGPFPASFSLFWSIKYFNGTIGK